MDTQAMRRRWRLPRVRTLESWIRHRDYRLLWMGNFCGNNAQWLQLLTVGWLVREMTEDSQYSSLLVIAAGGLGTLPVLVVGPWAGVLGDMVDRKVLLRGTQAFMACVAVLFAILVARDLIQEPWQVYLYLIVSGTCRTITMPMQQVLIANTVPWEDLSGAYATNVLTIPGTRAIEPFIGGILIATVGFAWNFAIEAVLYVAVVLVLIPMRTPYREARPAVRVSPFASLKEGIRYIWRGDRVILSLMVLALIPNVLLHPVWFLLPIFTSDVLGKGADFGGYLICF